MNRGLKRRSSQVISALSVCAVDLSVSVYALSAIGDCRYSHWIKSFAESFAFCNFCDALHIPIVDVGLIILLQFMHVYEVSGCRIPEIVAQIKRSSFSESELSDEFSTSLISSIVDPIVGRER